MLNKEGRIKERGGKYYIVDREGKEIAGNPAGGHKTRGSALAQLRAIEWRKGESKKGGIVDFDEKYNEIVEKLDSGEIAGRYKRLCESYVESYDNAELTGIPKINLSRILRRMEVFER